MLNEKKKSGTAPHISSKSLHLFTIEQHPPLPIAERLLVQAKSRIAAAEAEACSQKAEQVTIEVESNAFLAPSCL